MDDKNIFSGENKQVRYAWRIYQLIKTKQWFSYKDIAEKCLHPKKFDWNHEKVSNVPGYSEMKKAFSNVRDALKSELGEDFIEERGNNRAKEYCYVGQDDDPLNFYIETRLKKNVEDYFNFCQDSAGFFPSVWLEYFMGTTLDLYEINTAKASGRSIIGASLDRDLKNIHMLPKFYECVRDKIAVSIECSNKYKEDIETFIFHPHFLKEFNGRWWVFGHAEGKEPNDGYIVALDRITKDPKKCMDIEYIESQKVKYPDFFNDIVGVTHCNGRTQEITLRLYSQYFFGLVETKPIHQSQTTTVAYDKEIGYGEVKLKLRPNPEFYARILQLGPDAEIVAPESVRAKVAEQITAMRSRYE